MDLFILFDEFKKLDLELTNVRFIDVSDKSCRLEFFVKVNFKQRLMFHHTMYLTKEFIRDANINIEAFIASKTWFRIANDQSYKDESNET